MSADTHTEVPRATPELQVSDESRTVVKNALDSAYNCGIFDERGGDPASNRVALADEAALLSHISGLEKERDEAQRLRGLTYQRAELAEARLRELDNQNAALRSELSAQPLGPYGFDLFWKVASDEPEFLTEGDDGGGAFAEKADAEFCANLRPYRRGEMSNSVKCENCLTAPATHISHDGVDLCAKCHFAIPTDTLRPLTEKDMDTLSEMLGVKAVAERKAVASIDAILDAMEDAVNLHLDSPVTGDFMSLRRNWREHLNEALSRGDAARAELHRVRNVAVDLLAKRAEDMREYEKEIDRLRTVLLGFSQAWDCDDVATGAECRACLASGAIEINHSHSWKPRKRNWEGL